ncbi:MAG: FlgD immunoglobulin-like domain containing protein [Candidatus Eiseniibacteriota bacterium]
MPTFAIRSQARSFTAAMVFAAGLASPAVVGAVTYALNTPPSSLEVGCQGPCACPIVTTPTYGSFELIYSHSDPLYTYYDVERFIASFNNGPGAVAVMGSGQFRIGGEVALLEQLTLDIEIEGRPLQHFDSGLVATSAPFPELNLTCAVHGFVCLDSLLVVNAKPVDLSASGSWPSRPAGIQAVWPNPFPRETRIAFQLDRAGAVSLSVVDLEGRRVRSLLSSDFASQGARSVAWDGRGDDGRVIPPGVYWVRLRWSGGTDQRPVIKLE